MKYTLRKWAVGMSGVLWFFVAVPAALGWDTSQDMWSLNVGYGQSIPGWGQTSQRVQTIDIVPRYTHLTIDNLGAGWLKGRYSTLIELPVHIVTEPDSSLMLGLNALASYTFTADEDWQPYIFGGGGPVYSFADIPGMGADWNGNYQFALGLAHRLDSGTWLLFELRYHHISNAGAEMPNDPLNSVQFLAGFSF
ncbi:acyloxyacyl hydrolase [Thiorhodococcus mannitoliphagus]|uniref:Acyloxyacyl hydrolase n=1 Tax=Thiorhodococcus mannitoliphagus TaxID=329406 RepID=A0A6P1DYU5_9GAMM|nr:acyloxyacyl hydrolase [Thiorhodococcus mannitoliphagus]NEX20725.1 acyloxyacyl hydrolase [Thiorhodococcus mannitoliphagus]